MSPHVFETSIENITQLPCDGTKRQSDVHSRGGTSIVRYSRDCGGRHFYPTWNDDFDWQEDTWVPWYSTRFREVPQETCYTYETSRDIETLGRRISGIFHS